MTRAESGVYLAKATLRELSRMHSSSASMCRAVATSKGALSKRTKRNLELLASLQDKVALELAQLAGGLLTAVDT